MEKIQTASTYGVMGLKSGDDIQYDKLIAFIENNTESVNPISNVLPERIRVGDKVVILMPIFLKGEAQANVKGVVEKIDGEYYLVRPQYYKHFVECYRCELKKII